MHNNTQKQKKLSRLYPLLMALCIAQSIPAQAHKTSSIVGGVVAGVSALACLVGGSIIGYNNYQYNSAKSCIEKAIRQELDYTSHYVQMLQEYQEYKDTKRYGSWQSIVLSSIKKEHARIAYHGHTLSHNFPLLWYTDNLNNAIRALQDSYSNLVSYRSAMQKDPQYYSAITTDRDHAEIKIALLLKDMRDLYNDIISTREYRQEQIDLKEQEEYNAVQKFRAILLENKNAFHAIDHQFSQLRSIYDVSDFIHCLSDIISYQFTRITSYPPIYNSTVRNYYPQLWYETQLVETALSIQQLLGRLQSAHLSVARLSYYATQTDLELNYRNLIDRMNTTVTMFQVSLSRLRLSPLYIADLCAYESACAYVQQQARLEQERQRAREREHERDQERAREKNREYAREREHEAEMARAREKERNRDRERMHEREKEQERDRARDHEKTREKEGHLSKQEQQEQARKKHAQAVAETIEQKRLEKRLEKRFK